MHLHLDIILGYDFKERHWTLLNEPVYTKYIVELWINNKRPNNIATEFTQTIRIVGGNNLDPAAILFGRLLFSHNFTISFCIFIDFGSAGLVEKICSLSINDVR